MLTQVNLRNFKCFKLLKLGLKPLTLLSGTNASGKSTVLQALVLLHQSMRDQEWSNRLPLNGSTLQLGTISDIVDQVCDRRIFGIDLCDDFKWYAWEFAGERDDSSTAEINRLQVNGRTSDNPTTLRYLLPLTDTIDPLSNRLRDLTYLAAQRSGLRDSYPIDASQLTPAVGSTGEHTVSVLYSSQDNHVLDKLVIERFPPTLLRQVEARMSLFFPNFKLQLYKESQTNTISVGIRTSPDTEFHRPVHSGFGVTQVLPLVVAALSADSESILLIENPEVHLHPAGQAAIGEFLAEVASAGVQIILESHSDHVLSGIRRAVKKDIIRSEDAALHFFRSRTESESLGIPQVQTPILDASGTIDDWPEGFFDQFDKDMNYFAGWS